MGIFEISNKFFTLRVRANCLTCARRLAVDNAGEEGTLVWRDPRQSRITVIGPDNSGQLPGILERVKHEQSN